MTPAIREETVTKKKLKTMMRSAPSAFTGICGRIQVSAASPSAPHITYFIDRSRDVRALHCSPAFRSRAISVTPERNERTIVGTARFFREQDKKVEIVGVQPSEGASIPGIRRWPAAYPPTIFDASLVDRTIDVSQQGAEDTTRRLAREEGIFCGISSGGATAAALRLSQEVENAVIAVIICDRGDRYLSTGVFPD